MGVLPCIFSAIRWVVRAARPRVTTALAVEPIPVNKVRSTTKRRVEDGRWAATSLDNADHGVGIAEFEGELRTVSATTHDRVAECSTITPASAISFGIFFFVAIVAIPHPRDLYYVTWRVWCPCGTGRQLREVPARSTELRR